MLTLGQMIALAARAHENDLDKGGNAYILHPIRMMMRLRTTDEELMQIAIGHDVIEDHGDDYCAEDDTEWTYGSYIKLNASQRVIDGIDTLTKRKGESYEDFIERCALNKDAILVKLEDLRDNSDITRLKGLREKDFERMVKYQKAYARLLEAKKAFGM